MSFKIRTVDFLSENAPKEFVKSLKNTGFAIVRNHPLNKEVINTVFQDWENFFNSKSKHNYPFHKEKQDGYFPYQSENAKGYHSKDLKEFFHIYPWGRFPSEINQSTQIFYDQMIELGSEFLEWIDRNSPGNVTKRFSTNLDEMVEDSDQNLLRVINYPALNDLNTHGAIRAQEHADINLITLLVSATQPGLQVKNTRGKWVNVDSHSGDLIVNTGDMLQECSGGYFPSTIHRVMNPGEKNKHKARLSMPIFIHPSDEIILSDKYTAGQYLEERLKEIGLKH